MLFEDKENDRIVAVGVKEEDGKQYLVIRASKPYEQVKEVKLLLSKIDLKPVVRGEWEVIDYAEPRRYVCSICHIGLGWHTTNYCPNCGADMRGDK